MISERDGQLFVTGDMHLSTAAGLLAAGNAMLAHESRVISLAEVSVIDSAALAVLLGWMRTARSAGKRLEIVDAPAAFLSLADLYGVSSILFPESGSEARVPN